ncbi:peptidoglycan recognition family protein [Paenibacillus sp. ISL-20]|uniref:peptidoglycan recognition protein family protein n=1 Tax=Paenibacillus sp. ISL-20 TaxID=2819163 RepID=UPI001BE7B67C|nr:peptidoglycan recognition family protein [Paenibacillus sp. ISL-20]MBT2759829.1 N-acetylmuramoyl-L-alanine amidase [Paenibacillus sp. ISL-20]
MIRNGNFLLMEKSEFRDWLKQQAVTRPIKTLQVHHTWIPNYTTRKNQDPFKCLEGMRNSHLKQGWVDIGQNFTVLETGQIAYSLGRGLNAIPAGIKGANTNSLCIEIVGNFDIGGDKMTEEQKDSVVHLYACLAEKLNITVDTNHIVYHHWFDLNTGKRIDY